MPAGSWPCFPSRLGHFSWEALHCRPHRHKLVCHSPSQVLIDGSSGVEQLQHCCCRLWKAFWHSCFRVTLPMTSYQAHLRKSLYLVGVHRLGKERVDPNVCWSLGTSSSGVFSCLGITHKANYPAPNSRTDCLVISSSLSCLWWEAFVTIRQGRATTCLVTWRASGDGAGMPCSELLPGYYSNDTLHLCND